MTMIAFDSHKRYTFAHVCDLDGATLFCGRIEHQRGALTTFLRQWPAASPVALETVGNWYWIADEIEAAGMRLRLTHAAHAKLMLGCRQKKTDRLDAIGLNTLQRAGTLPTVWVPPAACRDLRELTRSRITLSHTATRFKNSIRFLLANYGLGDEDFSQKDIFGARARAELTARLRRLPPNASLTALLKHEQIIHLGGAIQAMEKQLICQLRDSPELRLLRTLPGVGVILAPTIAWEIGDISRFASAEQLAAYAGVVPRVHSSGGKTRLGRQRSDGNRILKWAFSEAANAICSGRTRRRVKRFVEDRYEKVRSRSGHGPAIGAVGRHLAEAAWHVLRNGEQYREPRRPTGA